MSATLTNCAIHQLVSRFNVDVQEEAPVVLHYIWKDDPAKASTLSRCISALEDEELYRALKVAHAHGMYDVVRSWKTSAYSTTPYFFFTTLTQNRRVICAEVPLPLSLCQDTAVKAEVHRFLAELQPTIRRLVVGDIVLPTWSPSDAFLDSETIIHLNSLKIPSLKGKPNLLLHDLGSFTRDFLLERRLRNIFMPKNHTFVILFGKFYISVH